MRYNGIFLVAIIIIIIMAILKSSLNIILLSTVKNEDIYVNLNIKYLFNMINIKMQLYPQKKKSKEKKNKEKKKKKEGNKNKISKQDIKSVYFAIKKIKIEELYSDIKFGNENIHFTCFIYLFVNTIYGNLINIINAKKMYLNVAPEFTSNFIDADIRIHIKPTIKNLIDILITVIKILLKNKKIQKEVKHNESTKFNKESYGDNS